MRKVDQVEKAVDKEIGSCRAEGVPGRNEVCIDEAEGVYQVEKTIGHAELKAYHVQNTEGLGRQNRVPC